MNFSLRRGKPFREVFNMKDADGNKVSIRGYDFELLVEHGEYARSFSRGSGISVDEMAGRVNVNLPGEVTQEFAYSNMYYTLNAVRRDRKEKVVSGVLRVIS